MTTTTTSTPPLPDMPEAPDPNSQWIDAAMGAIRQLAATGQTFDAADVRDLVPGEPTHPNTVGPVFIAAARAGLIATCGFTTSRRRSVHGSAVRLWRGTLAAREGRLRGGEGA